MHLRADGMTLRHVKEDIDRPDPAYADLYDRIGERPFVEHYLSVLAQLGTKSRVLDLGAGTGGLSIPIARVGIEVWAVEIQPQMVERIRRSAIPTLTVVAARIEDLSLPIKFELVILSSQLLNLVPPVARQKIYCSAVKHLSSNGVLAIEIGSPAWYSSRQSLKARGLRVSDVWFDTDQKQWCSTENQYDIVVTCHSYEPTAKRWKGSVTYDFGDIAFLQDLETNLLSPNEISEDLRPYGLIPASTPGDVNETEMELLYAFSDAGLFFEGFPL